MNLVNREMGLPGGITVEILDQSGLSVSAQVIMKWEAFAEMRASYLKQARGKTYSDSAFRNLVAARTREEVLKQMEGDGRRILDIFAEPNQNVGLSTKGDVHISVQWEWFPSLPEIDLSKLHVSSMNIESFSEDDIATSRERFLEANKVLVDYDGPIEKGDVVQTSWYWKVLPAEDDEWVSEEDVKTGIEVGISPRLDPEIERRLIGSRKGDVIDHSMTVPTNLSETMMTPQLHAHRKEVLKFAGKTVVVRLKIEEVRRFNRPDIGQPLFDKFNVKSTEELDEKILNRLKQYVEDMNHQYCISQILDFLRVYDFEISNRYIDGYSDDILARIARLYNVPLSNPREIDDDLKEQFMQVIQKDFPKYKTFDDFHKQVKEVAKKVACGDFAIEACVTKIDLQEVEINRIMLQLLTRNNLLYSKDYERVQNYMRDARPQIILGKIFEYLKSSDQVTSSNAASLSDFEEKVRKVSEDGTYLRYF